MAKADLTAQVVRELLDYNSGTGVFTWKPRPPELFKGPRAGAIWHARYCGQRAGHLSKALGYETIRIFDRAHFAHRLAWMHVTGDTPSGEIDHINCEKSDNRFENLRDVLPQWNKQNVRRAPRKVSLMPLGVYLVARDNLKMPYTAQLSFNGKMLHLGYFLTADEAHLAYLDGKRRLHHGCTI